MRHAARSPGFAFLVRAAALAAIATCALACTASDADSADDEDNASATSGESAFTGAIPSLVRTRQPAGTPASWPQPPSTGIVEQNGYCGATAAANLLSWYGREVSPATAIDQGCWSYVGTRPETVEAFLDHHHADLGCSYEKLPATADALGWLRGTLTAGKPVVVEFMTGELNAHWVTIVGVQGTGYDPKIVLMSWGRYYTTQWSLFEGAWRHAWGGAYPHVTCSAASPRAGALHVDK
jgi:hypothetical protein